MECHSSYSLLYGHIISFQLNKYKYRLYIKSIFIIFCLHIIGVRNSRPTSLSARHIITYKWPPFQSILDVQRLRFLKNNIRAESYLGREFASSLFWTQFLILRHFNVQWFYTLSQLLLIPFSVIYHIICRVLMFMSALFNDIKS